MATKIYKSKYQTKFKRDTKPLLEISYSILNHIIVIGDLVVPLCRDLLVDEVRFNMDYIAFIKDDEIFKYKYSEFDVLIKYSKPTFGIGAPNIEIDFEVSDGQVYRVTLNKKDNNFLSANFSKSQRDFLYQITKKTRRIKEKQISNFGILSYLLGIGLLALLLL